MAKTKVSKANPKFLILIERAGSKRIPLTFEATRDRTSKKRAEYFRSQLNAVCRACIDENHYLAPIAQRITTRMLMQGQETVLFVEPTGESFSDVFEGAGISMPEAPELSPTLTDEEEDEAEASVKEFFEKNT